MATSDNPRLPARTRAEIEAAMERFDADQRDGYNFGQNSFVVLHSGLLYPPKAIISLATGKSVREFSGGQPSNKYLTERGFIIIDLRVTGYEAVRAMTRGATDAEIAAD